VHGFFYPVDAIKHGIRIAEKLYGRSTKLAPRKLFFNEQVMIVNRAESIYGEFDPDINPKQAAKYGFQLVNTQYAKPVNQDRCPLFMSIEAMELAYNKDVRGVFWMTNYNYLPIVTTLRDKFFMEQVCIRNNFYPKLNELDLYDAFIGFDAQPFLEGCMKPIESEPEFIKKYEAQLDRTAKRRTLQFPARHALPWKEDKECYLMPDITKGVDIFHIRTAGNTLIIMDGVSCYPRALHSFFNEVKKLCGDFVLRLFVYEEDEQIWRKAFSDGVAELELGTKAELEIKHAPRRLEFEHNGEDWLIGKRWSELMIVEDAIRLKYEGDDYFKSVYFVSHDTALAPISTHMKHTTDFNVYYFGPKKIAMGHDMYLIHFDYFY